MYSGKEKALELGNQAINNPSLLDKLNEDTFIKFVIGISKYDKSLAFMVFDLKYDKISLESKILVAEIFKY